ncbi:MAG: helix-turn-helix transcriptional regulator [Bacteroidales bacterium]|nr:helix-turn-helix transcriptional regulator [Candidatus Colicola faecequi]
MTSQKKGLAAKNELQKLQPLSRKVQRAIDNKKYLESHLTLASMAHDLASNRTYLSDLIHQQYGLSFSDFINYLRIEEAKRILAETNDELLIKDLYVRLGYNSPTSFYRNFKRLTGMCTTDYIAGMKH